MATLFDHVDDDQRARLRAAGWRRNDCSSVLREPAEDVWMPPNSEDRFSLRGALAELERREERKP